MLLPPILEIFVLWHPADDTGVRVADWLLDHFHGSAFSGLVGGAVEVYTRSEGWERTGGPPRPLPGGGGSDTATLTVVIPVLSLHLARAVDDDEEWAAYVEAAVGADSDRFHVLPLQVHGNATTNTRLGPLVSGLQRLPDACADDPAELGREVAQGIVQRLSGSDPEPLQVFVSHTKRHSPDEEPDHVDRLVDRVRAVLDGTRLMDFFDKRGLQPGER